MSEHQVRPVGFEQSDSLLNVLMLAFSGDPCMRWTFPRPDVFLAAARAAGMDPARCIVVEDAAVGIEAARRAGMRSIGVSRTERLDADLAVWSLEDLPEDAFERLLARAR